MKKLRLLLLSAAMAFSLTACVPSEYDPLGLFQTSGTSSTTTAKIGRAHV